MSIKISLEVIPRQSQSLTEQVGVAKRCAFITHVNVPDIVHLPITSVVATRRIQGNRHPIPTITHLRAMDFAPGASLAEYRLLKSVLIIKGDMPKNPSHRTYTTTTLELIRRFKEELPHVTVYAAADLYNRKLSEAFEYIEEKVAAGADGFFTQPFFDLSVIEFFHNTVGDIGDIFLGVSPVLSEDSVRYWRRTNHIVFPQTHQQTLEYQVAFAHDVMRFAKDVGDSVYLMPITIGAAEYIEAIGKCKRL